MKATGEDLKAQGDYLKSEARGLRKDAATTSAAVGAVKGADWAGRVTLSGDIRYRYEAISDDTALNAAGITTADRYRDRIRARFNAVAKATDNITVGFGLTTTEGQDPRSGNQSLSGVFTKKPIELDLAYFDWKFATWGNLIGGKMKQPFVKGAQSLFWDNDITPEGVAFGFNRGIWFGTAYNFWLNEISGAENTLTSDAMMHGAQVGARLPFGSSTLTLAAHYYDLSASQGRSPGADLHRQREQQHDHRHRAEHRAGIRLRSRRRAGPVRHDARRHAVPGVGRSGAEPGSGRQRHRRVRRLHVRARQQCAHLGGGCDVPDAGEGRGVRAADRLRLRRRLLGQRRLWSSASATRRSGTGCLNATYFLNKRNVDVANGFGQTDVDYNRLQLDFNVKF